MKYLVAKLSINCHKLYNNLWTNIFSILESLYPSIFQSISDKVVVISSFECFLRNIWIDLMKSLGISPSSLFTHPSSSSSTIPTTSFEIHPFAASMSVMNHSIKHSKIEETNRYNSNLQLLEFQCICNNCNENQLFELSALEEGETLRVYFQQIAQSKEIVENIVHDNDNNSNNNNINNNINCLDENKIEINDIDYSVIDNKNIILEEKELVSCT